MVNMSLLCFRREIQDVFHSNQYGIFLKNSDELGKYLMIIWTWSSPGIIYMGFQGIVALVRKNWLIQTNNMLSNAECIMSMMFMRSLNAGSKYNKMGDRTKDEAHLRQYQWGHSSQINILPLFSEQRQVKNIEYGSKITRNK